MKAQPSSDIEPPAHSSEPAPDTADTSRQWALRLFERSPLKQQKFHHISELLPELHGLTCLDIGSDNGVVSLLLRQQGGTWFSCDLIAETVESIRTLVGERVSQISGEQTPYESAQFDLVVIVDFLEHIQTDGEFVSELARIIKPGGTLIANVPSPTRGIVRRLKHLVGQTDEAHGHVRPGYTLSELTELFGDQFQIETHCSYQRAFSDSIDLAITLALDILKRGGRGKKGTVVTGSDMDKLKKSFRLYSLIYPVVALFVKLDQLISFLPGNMLIVRAVRQER